MNEELPQHYSSLRNTHRGVIQALETLGKEVAAGPLDQKTRHLIQLAAAVAIRSEGACHSHVRRALAAGATPEEAARQIISAVLNETGREIAAAGTERLLEKGLERALRGR